MVSTFVCFVATVLSQFLLKIRILHQYIRPNIDYTPNQAPCLLRAISMSMTPYMSREMKWNGLEIYLFSLPFHGRISTVSRLSIGSANIIEDQSSVFIRDINMTAKVQSNDRVIPCHSHNNSASVYS